MSLALRDAGVPGDTSVPCPREPRLLVLPPLLPPFPSPSTIVSAQVGPGASCCSFSSLLFFPHPSATFSAVSAGSCGMSPGPAEAHLNKPGIDGERLAPPHTDREGSGWVPDPTVGRSNRRRMVTSDGAWPGFHLASMAWRWSRGESGLWGTCLGELSPVRCQRCWQPTPWRLVEQESRALRCCALGQHGWPGASYLLQDCDSPTQPHGRPRANWLRVFMRGRRAGSCSLLSRVCCVHTRQPQKPVAAWVHPAARTLPLAGLSVGAVRWRCPPGGALCPTAFSACRSPSTHPGAAGRQLSRCCHQQPGQGCPCP